MARIGKKEEVHIPSTEVESTIAVMERSCEADLLE